MTKYVLHGGNIRNSADGGKAYIEEIVTGLGNAPQLLLCLFSRPRENWEEDFEIFSKRITDFLKDKQVTCVMAYPEDYAEQASTADALLISGGDDELLQYRAQNTRGFVDSLKQLKVVAGSSAGADLLVENFWPCDWREPWKGFGILPQNIIVHYGSDFGKEDPRGPIDWAQAEVELRQAIGPEAVVSKLAEGQFEVFTV